MQTGQPFHSLPAVDALTALLITKCYAMFLFSTASVGEKLIKGLHASVAPRL